MQLLETILKANHDAIHGSNQGGTEGVLDADALPIVALTCIDARLNPLLPNALGLESSDFVWLRTPGNVISGPDADIVRAIALASALKMAKEIVVIGHTDCQVGKTTVLDLTKNFRAAGVGRQSLPENLNEAFGLFASEHQNVAQGVENLRASPLIGPNLPVHGLLIDTATGELQWVENGYHAAARASVDEVSGERAGYAGAVDDAAVGEYAGFKMEEWKSLDQPIGDFSFGPIKVDVAAIDEKIGAVATDAVSAGRDFIEQVGDDVGDRLANAFEKKFHDFGRFTIVGSDKKRYGPITGKKLLKWLAENRVTGNTMAQLEGSKRWQPLSKFLKKRSR